MRTTVRIDDDLMRQLQRQAQREKASLSRTLNRIIRQGLSIARPKRRRYVQKTYDLGKPLVNLDKALSLAFELDDERILEKMSQRQ
jgi:Ribbon-helix-helix protein, copG family